MIRCDKVSTLSSFFPFPILDREKMKKKRISIRDVSEMYGNGVTRISINARLKCAFIDI